MASSLALTLGDTLRVSRSTVGNMTDTHAWEQPPSPTQILDSELPASPKLAPDTDSIEKDQEGAEYILQLQENLGLLSSDDPTKPMQLFLLGCAIADHHVKAGIEGIGDMSKAIKLLEEAVDATTEDHNARRSFCNALQNMCWCVYETTRDKTHLDESIKYGRLAVGPKFPTDLEDPHTLLSQRYALALSRSLKERFEMALGERTVGDLDEAFSLLAPALAGEIATDHETRISELCSLDALKAEATSDIWFLDRAIGLRKHHSIDVLRGGWQNLRGLIALLGRRYEWTKEESDLDNLVQMSRLWFQPEVAEAPDYTVPLEYIATVASLPYHREGRKLFDLDTAICLHTIALLEIKRDSFVNLHRRRTLLEEVGSLLDDRWKLKGEERDGFAADEADLERGQIESILPLLGDGTVPLEQCGPFGVCTNYRSRVTGKHRMVSGFRIIFRRSLRPGEEWEEGDMWSSSVSDRSSDSEAGSEAHSEDELSVGNVGSLDKGEEPAIDVDENRSSQSPGRSRQTGNDDLPTRTVNRL